MLKRKQENVELGVEPRKRRRHLVDGERQNVYGVETRFVRGEVFTGNVQTLKLCEFRAAAKQLWFSQMPLG
jgi:hypothetical protein